ncbi:hypothetical protein ZWY2020_011394 [Hordeum vulgare]|nr:hypothetical protein ZWY2020_011394 [Hordeum vulgare]
MAAENFTGGTPTRGSSRPWWPLRRPRRDGAGSYRWSGHDGRGGMQQHQHQHQQAAMAQQQQQQQQQQAAAPSLKRARPDYGGEFTALGSAPLESRSGPFVPAMMMVLEDKRWLDIIRENAANEPSRAVVGAMGGAAMVGGGMSGYPVDDKYVDDGCRWYGQQSHGVWCKTEPSSPDASNTLYIEDIFRPFVGFREVRLVNKESRHPGGDPHVLCFVDLIALPKLLLHLKPASALAVLGLDQAWRLAQFRLAQRGEALAGERRPEAGRGPFPLCVAAVVAQRVVAAQARVSKAGCPWSREASPEADSRREGKAITVAAAPARLANSNKR